MRHPLRILRRRAALQRTRNGIRSRKGFISMRWLLAVLAIIVALVLIVVLVGELLPKNHSATRAARFRQPPDAIWTVITDYSKFPEWRKSVVRVEALPPVNGQPSWEEFDTHGNAIPYEIVEATPGQKLISRIADANLPFGGSWTYILTRQPDGNTLLRITEDAEIRNPVFRFVARFFIGYTKTMEDYLHALGGKFGEGVTIED
jgi:uncharacterized protein YndB with AHSA1/START domain